MYVHCKEDKERIREPCKILCILFYHKHLQTMDGLVRDGLISCCAGVAVVDVSRRMIMVMMRCCEGVNFKLLLLLAKTFLPSRSFFWKNASQH